MHHYFYTFHPLTLEILVCDSLVTSIKLSTQVKPTLPLPSWLKTPLDNYFLKGAETLELPFLLQVTPYQQRVLEALKTIPRGQKLTYQALSDKLGSHPRSIGQALKRNPLPLIFPCHRVVAKKSIGGFMGNRYGEAIDIKTQLLKLERK